jgi:hypothetical protein
MTSTSPLLVAGRSPAAMASWARVLRCPRNRARTGSGGGDAQRAQLTLGVGGGLDRRTARGQQGLQRGALRPGLGGGQASAGQRVAGGALGVQRVRAATTATGGPRRAVELDEDLTDRGKVAGQAGAVPAGTLHGEGPQPAVTLGHRQQLW